MSPPAIAVLAAVLGLLGLAGILRTIATGRK